MPHAGELIPSTFLKKAEYSVFAFLFSIYLFSFLVKPGIVVYIALSLPVLISGIVLVFALHRHLIIVTLLSSMSVIYNAPGIDMGEISYYLFMLLMLGVVLLPMVLNGQIKLETPLDTLFLVYTGFLFLGILVGFLQTGTLKKPVFEFAVFYSPVFFYFILRKYLAESGFRVWFILSIVFLFVYVVIRTYMSYRTSLMAAVEEWEFNFIRGAGNENFLLLGSGALLGSILVASKIKYQAVALFMLVISLGATVVTLTRSLWVVTVFSFGIIFLIVSPTERKRYIRYIFSAVLLVGLAGIIFWDFSLFIVEILAFRFKSFGEGTQDYSLLERIYETSAIWDKLMINPIMGYGLGTEFDWYSIIFGFTTKSTSYIHNGYLAIWYKLGFFGIATLLMYYALLFRYAFYMYRSADSMVTKLVGLTLVSYLPSAALMNITSPVFFTWEGTFILAAGGSYVSWFLTKGSSRSLEKPGASENEETQSEQA